jgi:hypothetical protein
MTTNEMRTAYTLTHKYYATSNGESNSKFAPVRQVIYKIPSIDECLKHLPKDIGNHILSYTTAWLEFYLNNLRQKYDYKFFRILLCEWLFNKTYISCMDTKKNTTDYIITEIINSYPRMSSKLKSSIPGRLTSALVWRQTQIAEKAERQLQLSNERKQKSNNLKMWIDHLIIGSIVRINRQWWSEEIGIVIYKTTTTYTVLITNEYHLEENACDVVFDIHSGSFISGTVLKQIERVIDRRPIYFNGVEIKIKETNKGTKKLAENIKQQFRDAEPPLVD